jgi:peptidoglycan hydrolase-like protein with peptidoglycan-binding domain
METSSVNIAATYNMPVLKQGDKGEAVRFLEQLLILRYGYTMPFDDNFTAATKTAVKDFQSSHGLLDDGIVGTLTWRALSENMACVP